MYIYKCIHNFLWYVRVGNLPKIAIIQWTVFRERFIMEWNSNNIKILTVNILLILCNSSSYFCSLKFSNYMFEIYTINICLQYSFIFEQCIH